MEKLVFLCGARDFHAMDWYRSAEEIIPKNKLSILTDLITGEGFKKIVSDKDPIEKMLILDKFLFKNQSSLGNKWRNIIKLLFIPIQVFYLKRHHKKNPNAVYYAHSMYYFWLAYLAKVDFIGTPQGSDILIKPFRSKIYRYLSIKSLQAAKLVTVDSVKMKEKCIELSNVTPYIVQNGIDIKSIQEFQQELSKDKKVKREKVLSIRGLTELYRIKELLVARGKIKTPITFIYPFHDDTYKSELEEYFQKGDEDLGRVNRSKMYELFHSTKLTFSIPSSDSSPRSVYEAIFCGSPVCITYHSYYDLLPDCMKERIVIVDIDNDKWFTFATEKAKEISKKEFVAKKEALEQFDQRESFRKILNLIDKLL